MKFCFVSTLIVIIPARQVALTAGAKSSRDFMGGKLGGRPLILLKASSFSVSVAVPFCADT